MNSLVSNDADDIESLLRAPFAKAAISVDVEHLQALMLKVDKPARASAYAAAELVMAKRLRARPTFRRTLRRT